MVFSEGFDAFTPTTAPGWRGHLERSYPTAHTQDGRQALRMLYRENEHKTCNLLRALGDGNIREIWFSYWLYLTADWQPATSGKVGFGLLDDRFKNSAGEPYGYGNRLPIDNGFSLRTAFDPSVRGADAPISFYTYHRDADRSNGKKWGDKLPLGTIRPGSGFHLIEGHVDLTGGIVEGRIDNAPWRSQTIGVGTQTRIRDGWLNGYMGGLGTSPTRMAADVDTVKVWTKPATPATSNLIVALDVARELRRLAGVLDEVAA